MKNIFNKYRLLIIILLVIVLTFLLYNTSLARYIYLSINNYILESQHFYFNSTILNTNRPTYSVTDWDGVNAYTLTIDVNSKKNELVSTESDILYDITYSCPSTVICNVSKTSSTIYKSSKTDSYVLTITPVIAFGEGDTVSVKTTAKSTYPYTKELSATYNIGVQNYGFSYNMIDSIGSKIATLELTNSKPYYEVKQAFLSYSVGDLISTDTYNKLTIQQKANCKSARVKLVFDPNILLLDSNNNVYIQNKSSEKTTIIDGFSYVNEFSFDMEATSNTKINFYKKNISENYNNNKSIVTVTVEN